MATINLTSIYANLGDWPGRLFETGTDTTILTTTATSFVFRLGPSAGDFADFRIVVSGTGFAYDGGEPIAGKMSSVRVLDGSGNLVISFTNLGNNSFVNDLSQFYASCFGTFDSGDGDGIDPQYWSAWGQLTAGNDTINGTDGDDWRNLVGFDAGNDLYLMGAGDDWITAALGKDTINGGDGYDTVSYQETNWILGAAAFRGATINMQTGVVLDPWGGRDVLIGIEEVQGSRFNDSYTGNNINRDRFMGLRGRDTIDGGANSFTTGGAVDDDRRDEARYHRDAGDGGRRGIIVDLETGFANNSISGTIRDGFGNLDVVRDIERVVGTRFNDTFVGSRMSNVFSGGQGVDSFDGEGDFDSIDFGRVTGNSGVSSGIVVNFTLATGQIQNDGYGNVETALNIESVWGTHLNDFARGNAREEEFYLADGRDTMTGGGGSDSFVWDNTGDLGDGDRVTDFQTTGPAADRLAFNTPDIEGMTGTLTLVNGTAATQAGVGTFVFNAANNTLFWDRDGAGGAAQVAVVVLVGVTALSAANFDLWT